MLNSIPNSWDQVTVEQFIQLKEMEIDKSQSLFSFRMEQLLILTETNIDDEIWETTPASELEDYFLKMKWLDTQPSRKFKNELILSETKYTFKPLEALTLGEFIDTEYLFGINYIRKLPNICSIFYRQTKLDDWSHLKYEPRFYSENERAQLFYEQPITNIFGILQEYLSFKKQFTESFEGMFQEDNIEDEDNYKIETIGEQEALSKEKILRKWSWEQLIYKFSKTYGYTFEEVTELNLIFVFNQLAMIRELKIQL